MLRVKIKAIIESTDDKNLAALKVLELLEDSGLSLVGNGWLDDDDEAIDYLSE